MNRLTFGMRPADIGAFDALPGTGYKRLKAWLDRQLDPSGIDDAACEARLAALKLDTLDMSLEALWQDYYLAGQSDFPLRKVPAQQVRKMIWTRAVYSERQLFEVITAFWRNHFYARGWDAPLSSVLPHFERDVIRTHALGNFREFLEAVATSTTMLYYLNNSVNKAAGPNENYARELFELHTLGAENYLGVGDPGSVPLDLEGFPVGYVDNDVYEATRCFTGWRVSNSATDAEVGNNGAFYYHRPWHDRFNKLVLGQYLPADQGFLEDGLTVLDLLASHPGTSRFIARKLCRWLVGDNPSEALVEAAALVFRQRQNAPDQLRRVVRAILLHPEFRTTWAEKLKDPFRVTAAMLRAVQPEWRYSDKFTRFFDAMGMPMLGHQSPDGYPDGREAWQGTTSMLYRWRMCNAIIEKKFPGISFDLIGQMPASALTAHQIADFWIDRLLGRRMHPEENRLHIVTYLAQGTSPDFPLTSAQIAERVPGAVAIILMAPDFQFS